MSWLSACLLQVRKTAIGTERIQGHDGHDGE